MLFDLFGNTPWFAPKRFGFGSGLPIAWQGWVFLLAHLAAIGGLAFVLRPRPLAHIVVVALAVLLPLPIYARHTRGGWKWRNGGEA